MPDSLIVRDGTCHVLFAHDVGLAINLDECERRITTLKQRERIRHKRRAPNRYFEYQQPPLRLTRDVSPVSVGGHASTAAIDLFIHDFGGVTVVFSFPLSGPLSGLLELSDALYENLSLREHARRMVGQCMEVIMPAITRPRLAAPCEDYAIFEFRALEPALTPDELRRQYRGDIARILRAETTELSQQEIDDAMSCCMSLTPADIAIVDWNSALIIDANGDDTRTVLELVNLELLEMKHLDEQLDDALEQAYQTLVVAGQRPWWRRTTRLADDLRRIAKMQVDNAMLFESTQNALKLLGDQFLARLYRLASQRFHLQEWDDSILRKLQTLESIYQKLNDRQSTRRMEALEWIIIILIAISIALPFLPIGGK